MKIFILERFYMICLLYVNKISIWMFESANLFKMSYLINGSNELIGGAGWKKRRWIGLSY